MKISIKTMVLFVVAGLAPTIVCLVKTTPLTMLAFFMVGLPCFAAAILIYALFLLRLIKINTNP